MEIWGVIFVEKWKNMEYYESGFFDMRRMREEKWRIKYMKNRMKEKNAL